MSLTFWNAVVLCYSKNILKEFQISLEPLSVRVKVNLNPVVNVNTKAVIL